MPTNTHTHTEPEDVLDHSGNNPSGRLTLASNAPTFGVFEQCELMQSGCGHRSTHPDVNHRYLSPSAWLGCKLNTQVDSVMVCHASLITSSSQRTVTQFWPMSFIWLADVALITLNLIAVLATRGGTIAATESSRKTD